jgi:hypothetical protein
MTEAKAKPTAPKTNWSAVKASRSGMVKRFNSTKVQQNSAEKHQYTV